MEERRQAKKRMDEEGKRKYRKLNNELRRECEKARKKWLDEKCNEIEELEKTGKYEEAYRKIKEFNGGGGGVGGNSKCIESREGKELFGEKALRRWKEYIEELYDKKEITEGTETEDEEEVNECSMGYRILESEVRQDLKEMKRGKAPGVDELPVELMKNLNDKGVENVIGLCNKIYERGEWPEEFLKTVMKPIPKKKGRYYKM
ncbi:hypothetical protein J437_LFUL017384 [Ladona fulva]|uniref:Reverse transcriptase n=1 Tax=Ladona fulva TaxID=123851 RepID=A0A8K0KMJ5_LADFU|nr:hypothetical protein J437_LFUL017384 [Ladona fulva]